MVPRIGWARYEPSVLRRARVCVRLVTWTRVAGRGGGWRYQMQPSTDRGYNDTVARSVEPTPAVRRTTGQIFTLKPGRSTRRHVPPHDSMLPLTVDRPACSLTPVRRRGVTILIACNDVRHSSYVQRARHFLKGLGRPAFRRVRYLSQRLLCRTEHPTNSRPPTNRVSMRSRTRRLGLGAITVV